MSTPSKWQIYSGFAFALVAYSFAAIFINLAEVPPFTMAFYRMFGAGLVVTALSRGSAFQDIRGLPKDLQKRLFIGSFFLSGHFALWTMALDFTSVNSCVVLLASQPIFGAWFGAKFFGEPLQRSTMWALGIAVFGCLLVGYGDYELSVRAVIGDLLVVASCAMIAVYYGFGKRVRQQCGNMSFMSTIFLLCAAWLLAGVLVTGSSLQGFPTFSWQFIGLAILVPTLGGHLLYNWLVKYIRLSTLNLGILVEPPLTAFFMYLIKGSPVRPTQVAGFVVLCFAVGLEVLAELRK